MRDYCRMSGPRRFLVLLLPAVGVGMTIATVALMWDDGSQALDFHRELYPQAVDVIHGRDPYPSAEADLSDGSNAIWPIVAAWLVAPLALLPSGAADAIWTAVTIACIPGALLIAGVRDARVVGVVLLWPPAISTVQTGNVTALLSVLLALAWRRRDRQMSAGLALGLALGLKFFLWPVVLLVAQLRHVRAALLAAAVGAVSLAAIAAYHPLDEYVRLLRNLSDTFDGSSYTPFGLLVEVGLREGPARAIGLAVAVACLALALARHSLALTVLACLLLSPIVWLHFFLMLAVPLAFAAPRLHWVWFLPLPLWTTPGTGNGEAWQTALALAVSASTCVAGALLERRPLLPTPLAATA